MNQYLLLLHENPADYANLSPAEMQDIIARYSAWVGEMAAKGHLVSGEKLTEMAARLCGATTRACSSATDLTPRLKM